MQLISMHEVVFQVLNLNNLYCLLCHNHLIMMEFEKGIEYEMEVEYYYFRMKNQLLDM